MTAPRLTRALAVALVALALAPAAHASLPSAATNAPSAPSAFLTDEAARYVAPDSPSQPRDLGHALIELEVGWRLEERLEAARDADLAQYAKRGLFRDDANYGFQRTENVAELNRTTYTGHYYDREANLYSTPSRYLDPETGRFLSQDGLEYGNAMVPPSLHRYLYAQANPLRYVDLDGHAAGDETWGTWARKRAEEAMWTTSEFLVHDRFTNTLSAVMPGVNAPGRILKGASDRMWSKGRDLSPENFAIGFADETLNRMSLGYVDRLDASHASSFGSDEPYKRAMTGPLGQTITEEFTPSIPLYRMASENLTPVESMEVMQQAVNKTATMASIVLPAAKGATVALESKGVVPEFLSTEVVSGETIANITKAADNLIGKAGQIVYESVFKYEEGVTRSGFGPVPPKGPSGPRGFVRPGEVTTFEDFRLRSRVGDELEGHELMQHALLKDRGKATTRLSTEASKKNIVLAVPRDVHLELNKAQAGIDVSTQTPLENIGYNANAALDLGVARSAVYRAVQRTIEHARAIGLIPPKP